MYVLLVEICNGEGCYSNTVSGLKVFRRSGPRPHVNAEYWLTQGTQCFKTRVAKFQRKLIFTLGVKRMMALIAS